MNQSPGLPKGNQVIVLQTHVWTDEVRSALRGLTAEAPPGMDVHVLADVTQNRIKRDDIPAEIPFFEFTHDVVKRFKAEGPHCKGWWACNVETALMAFWEAHPDYDYYWLVEHDVVFTGAWGDFFDHFTGSEADLLATNIFRRSSGYDWPPWKSLRSPYALTDEQQIRAFYPLYRISVRALEALVEEYGRGWTGHYECTLATALNYRGLTIEDIGGDGEFVAPANRNRFYTSTPSNAYLSPGTFVFRPTMEKPGDRANTLWHPVKSMGVGDWERERPRGLAERLKKLYWGSVAALRRLR